MSNRLLWILILLWFIGIWYLYYNLSYIPNIESERLKIIENEIKINKEKELKEKEIKLVKQDIIGTNKTNKEIINEIKENIKNYKTFKLSNWLKAYFIKNSSNTLDLYYNENKIWNFKLVYNKYLVVDYIVWSKWDLYIEIWKEKYIYNNITKLINKIELNIKIKYVKKDKNWFIFITDKWSFIYNVSNKKLEYFSYFDDFISMDNWYVWIIKKNDLLRIKNLWINKINNDIIYFYNPVSKEKKVVFNLNIDYKKIYKKGDNVYLDSKDNNSYILENIKKNLN